MKPFGYMVVNHNSRWGYEKGRYAKEAQENGLKSQRARQRRETQFLIYEQLGNRNPNDPCQWGECDHCSASVGRWLDLLAE